MRHPEKCDRCKDKPCKNNPYNEDGECWGTLTSNSEVIKAIKENHELRVSQKALQDDGREIPLPRDYRISRKNFEWVAQIIARECPELSGAYLMVLLLEAKYDGGENGKA